MHDEPQPGTTTAMPTCYRHADRPTLLSCGRCGRPLCPDCTIHGPVGIRCAECLRPPKVVTQLAAPERTGLAIGIAMVEALAWAAALVVLGWKSGNPAPNLLLCGIAGAIDGWTIWRLCGRSANLQTALTALGIGLAIPLLAMLGLAQLVPSAPFAGLPEKAVLIQGARVAAAMAICGLFSWLLATLRRWEGQDLF